MATIPANQSGAYYDRIVALRQEILGSLSSREKWVATTDQQLADLERVLGQWIDLAPHVTEEGKIVVPVVSHMRQFVDDGTQGSDLRNWWLSRAEREVDPMIAKAVEYGGNGRALDLEEIGRGLVQSGVKVQRGEEGWTNSEAMYQELGIYFYLLGKFARWTAAVAEGRQVSDDTLLDIGVYVRMAQRIRDVGGWPV